MLQENILFFPNEDTNVHLEINELENRKVVMNGGLQGEGSGVWTAGWATGGVRGVNSGVGCNVSMEIDAYM